MRLSLAVLPLERVSELVLPRVAVVVDGRRRPGDERRLLFAVDVKVELVDVFFRQSVHARAGRLGGGGGDGVDGVDGGVARGRVGDGRGDVVVGERVEDGFVRGRGSGWVRGGTSKTSISSSLLVSSSEETSPFIMEPVTSISPDDLVPAAERAAGATKARGVAVANPRELGALGLVPRGGSGASAPRGRFVSGGAMPTRPTTRVARTRAPVPAGSRARPRP